MILKELQLTTEALWGNVKTHTKFFASIQTYVKRFSEFDYTNLNSENIDELVIFSERIENFFVQYRATGDGLYFPPNETSFSDKDVIKINELVRKLKQLSPEELKQEIKSIKPQVKKASKGKDKIFIGHGRSKLWSRVQVFFSNELKLDTVYFESESRTSETIINILEGFLSDVSFAVIIMTAEDETADDKIRARQNVIHEAGLFQGRLGFDKVIILKQNNIEEFSNIAGLQYISFSDNNVEQTFYELQRCLKKIGLC